MNIPTKTEFLECQQLIAAVMAHLTGSQWNFSVNTDFAQGIFNSPRLNGIQVLLSQEVGVFYDVSRIKATSHIKLQLPKGSYGITAPPRRAAATQQVEAVLHGVLVHEVTHKIQELNFSESFKEAVALTNYFNNLPNKTPDDWYDLYLGQPFEREARACQAAAEVFAALQGGAANTFDQQLPNTEIFKRSVSEIGGPAVGSKVQYWWQLWGAMAWDIYQTI